MSEADTLREEIRVLREQVAALQERNARDEEESSNPTRTPDYQPPPAPIVSLKEPKIGEPPTFDGKQSDFYPFLNQCKLFLRMRTLSFRNDETKIAYIISRLRAGPSEWAQALMESDSPLLFDYDAFLTKFISIYGNKERKTQLQDKLAKMTQTGSASAFAAEFSAVCDILGLDDVSRMSLFRQRLKPAVREGLAYVPAVDTFDELVERAVRIDHAQYSLRKPTDSRQTPHSKSTDASSNSSNALQKPSHKGSSSSKSSGSASYSNRSTPRGPLTAEEKAYRLRHGLCMFCKSPDHNKDNCPALQAKIARQEGQTGPKSSSTASVSQVVVSTSDNNPFRNSGKPSPQGQ